MEKEIVTKEKTKNELASNSCFSVTSITSKIAEKNKYTYKNYTIISDSKKQFKILCELVEKERGFGHMFLSENVKNRIRQKFFEKTGFDLTLKHNLELINKQIKQIQNEINNGLNMKVIAEQEKYYQKYKIRCQQQNKKLNTIPIDTSSSFFSNDSNDINYKTKTNLSQQASTNCSKNNSSTSLHLSYGNATSSDSFLYSQINELETRLKLLKCPEPPSTMFTHIEREQLEPNLKEIKTFKANFNL